MINVIKIFYTAIFNDRDWNFEEDRELRGVIQVRPFNAADIPANQLCFWIDKLGDLYQYQIWWWEFSPPASLPQIGDSFALSDLLYCQIKRVWKGQNLLYAILQIIPMPPSLSQRQPVFVTIRGKQRWEDDNGLSWTFEIRVSRDRNDYTAQIVSEKDNIFD